MQSESPGLDQPMTLEQAFEAFMRNQSETNAGLQATLQHLLAKLDEQQGRLDTVVAQLNTQVTPILQQSPTKSRDEQHHHRPIAPFPCKLPPMAHFKGHKRDLPAWLQMVRTYLTLSQDGRGMDLNSPHTVAFVAMHLQTPETQGWMTSCRSRYTDYSSPLFLSGGHSSFDEFERAILAGCGVIKAADEARDFLRTISQGFRSVTAYATEFATYAAALPKRDVDDLTDDFVRGLKKPLQTSLALAKLPTGTHWHQARDTALDLERPEARGKPLQPALLPEPSDPMDLNAVSFGNRPPPPHRSAPARPGSSSGPRLDQMSAQELREILKRFRGCYKCGQMFADHTKSTCPGQQHPALLHLEVVDDDSEFEFPAVNSVTLASSAVVRDDSLDRITRAPEVLKPVQLMAMHDPCDADTRNLMDGVEDYPWSAVRPSSFRHLDVPIKLLCKVAERVSDDWYSSDMMPNEIKSLFVVGEPMFPLPALWRIDEDAYGAPRLLTWYKHDQVELANIKGIIPRSLIQTADIRNKVDGGMVATRLFFAAPPRPAPITREESATLQASGGCFRCRQSQRQLRELLGVAHLSEQCPYVGPGGIWHGAPALVHQPP